MSNIFWGHILTCLKDPFNDFYKLSGTVEIFYTRVITPFVHAIIFSAICGLALGLQHRATVVKENEISDFYHSRNFSDSSRIDAVE